MIADSERRWSFLVEPDHEAQHEGESNQQEIAKRVEREARHGFTT